jgi:hypothetical protein
MKKISLVLASLLVATSLAACNEKSKTSSETKVETGSTPATMPAETTPPTAPAVTQPGATVPPDTKVEKKTETTVEKK